MPVPEDDIARVAEAHARLVASLESLTDDDVRRPSLLPDWSVAHVLTHVARNADSHVRRTEAAVRGEMVDQYPGGVEARAAEIEAGAGRTAAELVERVRATAAAVDDVWRTLSPAAWEGRSRDVSGRERSLFELPSRRWQEVEVHSVDLGLGVTHRDWPEDFVLVWLPRIREWAAAQAPETVAASDFEDPRDELAWLYGRLTRADLPAPPPWG